MVLTRNHRNLLVEILPGGTEDDYEQLKPSVDVEESVQPTKTVVLRQRTTRRGVAEDAIDQRRVTPVKDTPCSKRKSTRSTSNKQKTPKHSNIPTISVSEEESSVNAATASPVVANKANNAQKSSGSQDQSSPTTHAEVICVDKEESEIASQAHSATLKPSSSSVVVSTRLSKSKSLLTASINHGNSTPQSSSSTSLPGHPDSLVQSSDKQLIPPRTFEQNLHLLNSLQLPYEPVFVPESGVYPSKNGRIFAQLLVRQALYYGRAVRIERSHGESTTSTHATEWSETSCKCRVDGCPFLVKTRPYVLQTTKNDGTCDIQVAYQRVVRFIPHACSLNDHANFAFEDDSDSDPDAVVASLVRDCWEEDAADAAEESDHGEEMVAFHVARIGHILKAHYLIDMSVSSASSERRQQLERIVRRRLTSLSTLQTAGSSSDGGETEVTKQNFPTDFENHGEESKEGATEDTAAATSNSGASDELSELNENSPPPTHSDRNSPLSIVDTDLIEGQESPTKKLRKEKKGKGTLTSDSPNGALVTTPLRRSNRKRKKTARATGRDDSDMASVCTKVKFQGTDKQTSMINQAIVELDVSTQKRDGADTASVCNKAQFQAVATDKPTTENKDAAFELDDATLTKSNVSKLNVKFCGFSFESTNASSNDPTFDGFEQKGGWICPGETSKPRPYDALLDNVYQPRPTVDALLRRYQTLVDQGFCVDVRFKGGDTTCVERVEEAIRSKLESLKCRIQPENGDFMAVAAENKLFRKTVKAFVGPESREKLERDKERREDKELELKEQHDVSKKKLRQEQQEISKFECAQLIFENSEPARWKEKTCANKDCTIGCCDPEGDFVIGSSSQQLVPRFRKIAPLFTSSNDSGGVERHSFQVLSEMLASIEFLKDYNGFGSVPP